MCVSSDQDNESKPTSGTYSNRAASALLREIAIRCRGSGFEAGETVDAAAGEDAEHGALSPAAALSFMFFCPSQLNQTSELQNLQLRRLVERASAASLTVLGVVDDVDDVILVHESGMA